MSGIDFQQPPLQRRVEGAVNHSVDVPDHLHHKPSPILPAGIEQSAQESYKLVFFRRFMQLRREERQVVEQACAGLRQARWLP